MNLPDPLRQAEERPYVPLIPDRVRRSHSVAVATDHGFKAAARLLQALWRQERDLPHGAWTDPTGRRRYLGSRLSRPNADLGANFLHRDILSVVAQALAYREPGALYDVDRLKANLLSSQTLAFNLFGWMQRDLSLATRVLAELLPGVVAEVTDVGFEHSPGRGEPRFTNDGTAFDVVMRGRSGDGDRVLVAVEVKYSEHCHDSEQRLDARHSHIAVSSELFVRPDEVARCGRSHQQLFWQHCLLHAMLSQGLADRAVLAFVAPHHNHLAQTVAARYATQLRDAENGTIPFVRFSLERAFSALSAAGLPKPAAALHERYTDWSALDRELMFDAETYGIST